MIDTFIILKPRKAESKVALSLVKDSGGIIVDHTHPLGVLVMCKKSVAQALDLIHVFTPKRQTTPRGLVSKAERSKQWIS